MSAGRVTSKRRGCTFLIAPSALRSSSFRAVAYTTCPCAARCSVILRPMPLLAPVTRTALETVGSLDCAGAHSSAASSAHIVVRSTRMSASLLRMEPKSRHSVVTTTGRTQTAYCIWPAIRCPGPTVRYVSSLFERARYIMLRTHTGSRLIYMYADSRRPAQRRMRLRKGIRELSGYSYELSMYRPQPMPDLFERMHGYACIEAACEAGRFQLLSTGPKARVRRRRTRRRTIPAARLKLQVLPFDG